MAMLTRDKIEFRPKKMTKDRKRREEHYIMTKDQSTKRHNNFKCLCTKQQNCKMG